MFAGAANTSQRASQSGCNCKKRANKPNIGEPASQRGLFAAVNQAEWPDAGGHLPSRVSSSSISHLIRRYRRSRSPAPGDHFSSPSLPPRPSASRPIKRHNVNACSRLDWLAGKLARRQGAKSAPATTRLAAGSQSIEIICRRRPDESRDPASRIKLAPTIAPLSLESRARRAPKLGPINHARLGRGYPSRVELVAVCSTRHRSELKLFAAFNGTATILRGIAGVPPEGRVLGMNPVAK